MIKKEKDKPVKLYLIKSFSTDEKIKENPPLSEKGIKDAKLVRLLLPDVTFDCCYTGEEIASYGSAMLMIGDKLVIKRDKRLNKEKSTKVVENNITSYLSSLKDENMILIVADSTVIKALHKQVPNAIEIK